MILLAERVLTDYGESSKQFLKQFFGLWTVSQTVILTMTAFWAGFDLDSAEVNVMTCD